MLWTSIIYKHIMQRGGGGKDTYQRNRTKSGKGLTDNLHTDDDMLIRLICS